VTTQRTTEGRLFCLGMGEAIWFLLFALSTIVFFSLWPSLPLCSLPAGPVFGPSRPPDEPRPRSPKVSGDGTLGPANGGTGAGRSVFVFFPGFFSRIPRLEPILLCFSLFFSLSFNAFFSYHELSLSALGIPEHLTGERCVNLK